LSARSLGARLDLEDDLLTAHERIKVDGRVHPTAVEEILLAIRSLDKSEAALGYDLLDNAS